MAAAGYHLFVAGNVLTAAQCNTFLMEQSVMNLASASARDTALSSVKTAGNVCYLQDVKSLSVYTGTSTTWSTVGPVWGALTSWTPVVVQGATPTLTNGESTYERVGRWVQGKFEVTITSNGTASNLITITLPVAADTSSVSGAQRTLGVGTILDSSAAGEVDAYLVLASSTTLKFKQTNGQGTPTTVTYQGTSGMTAALANGDVLTGTFAYEAAADG